MMDSSNNNKENIDKTDKKETNEMNENENNEKYQQLLQKLKANKLEFILDKLELKEMFDSIENKKKMMNEAVSILNNEQIEIFKNIIDLNSVSILKPSSYKNEPIKPPKPRESASSLPPKPPNIDLKRSSIPTKTNSLPPPLITNTLNSTTIYMNHNNHNNHNMNIGIGTKSIVTPNVEINVSNITGSDIPSAPQKQAILFKDMVNASLSPQKLIKNGLSAISKAYGKHINDIHNELKRHQRTTTMAIKHIDDKLNMLSLHKKQLKINLANLTRDVIKKLDELQAHKTYIDAVNDKYETSLQIANNTHYNKNGYLYCSNLLCKQCGHSFIDESELNTHLEIHKNEIPKLSATEWKNTLLDLMACYQPQIQQFEQEQNQKLKNLKIPMFPANIIENQPHDLESKQSINNNINNKNISNNVNIMDIMKRNNNKNINNVLNQQKYLGTNIALNTNLIAIPQFNINTTNINKNNNNNMNNLQILGSNKCSSKQLQIVDITESGSPQTSDIGSESSEDDNNNNNNNNNNDNESDYDSESSSESEPIINQKKRKLQMVPISFLNQKTKKRKQENENKTEKNGYPLTLDLETVIKFTENELIDYRDFNARYLAAKIMQIDDEKFGIHYINWDNKWNVWSIPKYQFRRYAIYGSVSQRGLHRESMKYVSLQRPWGDFIEVRPLHLHYHSMYKLKQQQQQQQCSNDSKIDKKCINKYLEWHIGQICLSDKFSAQVQVVLFRENQFGEWFKPQPKADLYWVHLDNEQECAPKNTHIINPKIKKTVKKKKSVKRSNNNNIDIQRSGPPTKKQRQN